MTKIYLQGERGGKVYICTVRKSPATIEREMSAFSVVSQGSDWILFSSGPKREDS